MGSSARVACPPILARVPQFFACTGLPLVRKLKIPRLFRPSNSFHWPFKNKTIHVHISFSFFCKLSILLSSVLIFFRFLRDFERKAFDFTNKSIPFCFFVFQRKPLTTTTTCVRHRVLNSSGSLLYSIHFLFSRRKCIEKSCRKLISYKPEHGIPWLFTDFANIIDFSLTLKNFRFSLIFPWLWQPCRTIVPRFIRDFSQSNYVSTCIKKITKCRIYLVILLSN